MAGESLTVFEERFIHWERQFRDLLQHALDQPQDIRNEEDEGPEYEEEEVAKWIARARPVFDGAGNDLLVLQRHALPQLSFWKYREPKIVWNDDVARENPDFAIQILQPYEYWALFTGEISAQASFLDTWREPPGHERQT